MSAVPIDAKARGSLLSAGDSLADFEQDIKPALDAIEHCGVSELSLKAYWLEQNLGQLRKAYEQLRAGTTEAKANKFLKSGRAR